MNSLTRFASLRYGPGLRAEFLVFLSDVTHRYTMVCCHGCQDAAKDGTHSARLLLYAAGLPSERFVLAQACSGATTIP